MRYRSPRYGIRLAAIVLAAGASSRLGRSKQLLRRHTEPLVVRAARLAARCADGPVLVVTGAQQLRVRSCLRRYRLPAHCVHNRNWRAGMATSLRAGIDRLPQRCSGVLIMLTDQALLEPGDVARLVKRWRQHPYRAAAAAAAGRQPGAPAILPRRLLAQTRTITGDQGARHLLRREAAVTVVAMPAAAFDIDTAADLDALKHRGAVTR